MTCDLNLTAQPRLGSTVMQKIKAKQFKHKHTNGRMLPNYYLHATRSTNRCSMLTSSRRVVTVMNVKNATSGYVQKRLSYSIIFLSYHLWKIIMLPAMLKKRYFTPTTEYSTCIPSVQWVLVWYGTYSTHRIYRNKPDKDWTRPEFPAN